MPYLYRITVSYQGKGSHGTPIPLQDYFYKVYSPRRLTEKELEKRKSALTLRTHRHLKAQARLKHIRVVHERTGLERITPTRTRKRIIEASTIRYRKGKPVRVQLRTTTYGPKRTRKHSTSRKHRSARK